MDRGNFFLKSTNSSQFRAVLFGRQEFEELKRRSSIRNMLSQVNISGSLSCTQENQDDTLFITPPIEKTRPITPMAPKKPTKQRNKTDLKPKKLVYSDVEEEEESGIFFNSADSTYPLYCKQRTNRCNVLKDSQKHGTVCTVENKTAKKSVASVSLSANLERRQLRSNDKENDKKNIIKSTRKPNTKSNTVGKVLSIDFNPEATIISQCDSNVGWQEKLRWLQPRRDIGLWVECCRRSCKKWRYVEQYHDPIDVPEIWYCEMNSDKTIASCVVPEKRVPPAIQEDLIENEYNAGSIVWAHVKGFPWWPGMVDDCPETFTYYKLRKYSIKPYMYYIVFFNESKVEFAWVHRKDIKPFVKHTYNELVKKTKVHKVEYKPDLDKAYEMAYNATKLTILERLQRFSYVSIYENVSNNNEQTLSKSLPLNSSFEEEVQPSPYLDTHMTLKDYHSQMFSKRRNRTN